MTWTRADALRERKKTIDDLPKKKEREVGKIAKYNDFLWNYSDSCFSFEVDITTYGHSQKHTSLPTLHSRVYHMWHTKHNFFAYFFATCSSLVKTHVRKLCEQTEFVYLANTLHACSYILPSIFNFSLSLNTLLRTWKKQELNNGSATDDTAASCKWCHFST